MTGKGPVPNPGFTVYPPSEHDVKQMKPAEKMLDDDIVNTQDDQILIGKTLILLMKKNPQNSVVFWHLKNDFEKQNCTTFDLKN